jgi:curved DNA-binding protein CbpA
MTTSEPDPFDVLGLPPQLELSASDVEAAYLKRAALAHPDIAGGEGESARAMARLNDAKRTLLDLEKRAQTILARLGGPSADADRALPEGFLMEMMETREAMESEIAADPDAAGRWRQWGLAKRREHAAEVAACLQRGELKAARVALNAWRYVERLIEQVGRNT